MGAEDELSEFTGMWDGSEEWYLTATSWTKSTLTVVFAGDGPSIEELMALRRLREEFRALPIAECKALLAGKREVKLSRCWGLDPHEMKRQIAGEGRADLESFSSLEEHEITDLAARLQVPFWVRSEGESGLDYAPIRIVNGQEQMAIIEDEELEKRVVRKMLEHEVPIVFIEDDG